MQSRHLDLAPERLTGKPSRTIAAHVLPQLTCGHEITLVRTALLIGNQQLPLRRLVSQLRDPATKREILVGNRDERDEHIICSYISG